jgi:hypothetical protein
MALAATAFNLARMIKILGIANLTGTLTQC